jgi:RNA recognition motif-containing protein
MSQLQGQQYLDDNNYQNGNDYSNGLNQSNQQQYYLDGGVPSSNDTGGNIDDQIFIGGFSWTTNEQIIQQYFEKFGEVSEVSLKYDRNTGKPR